MKALKTEIIVEGRVIANVEIYEVHEKYFRMILVLPNGSERQLFISYKSLEPVQDWQGELKRELKTKA